MHSRTLDRIHKIYIINLLFLTLDRSPFLKTKQLFANFPFLRERVVHMTGGYKFTYGSITGLAKCFVMKWCISSQTGALFESRFTSVLHKCVRRM